MQLMKILFWILCTTLFFNSYAKAATFSYTPTQDVSLNSLFNRYSAIDVVNHGLPLGSYQNGIVYLQFDISSILVTNKFKSAKLRMYVTPNMYPGTLNSVNLYHVSNDNWNEGQLYYGSVSGLNNLRVAFDGINKPEFTDNDLITSFKQSSLFTYGNWENNYHEWVFDKNMFDLSTTGDKVSFALKMTGSGSVTYANSEDGISYDKLLATNYYYGHAFNTYEVSSHAVSKWSPLLTIETEPVPEPSSIILGLLGLSGAIGLKRKKN